MKASFRTATRIATATSIATLVLVTGQVQANAAVSSPGQPGGCLRQGSALDLRCPVVPDAADDHQAPVHVESHPHAAPSAYTPARHVEGTEHATAPVQATHHEAEPRAVAQGKPVEQTQTTHHEAEPRAVAQGQPAQHPQATAPRAHVEQAEHLPSHFAAPTAPQSSRGIDPAAARPGTPAQAPTTAQAPNQPSAHAVTPANPATAPALQQAPSRPATQPVVAHRPAAEPAIVTTAPPPTRTHVTSVRQSAAHAHPTTHRAQSPRVKSARRLPATGS